jgi:hypothetical protein
LCILLALQLGGLQVRPVVIAIDAAAEQVEEAWGGRFRDGCRRAPAFHRAPMNTERAGKGFYGRKQPLL